MLIESKIRREGGTIVDMGKGANTRRYHFKPQAPLNPNNPEAHLHVPHVAEVENENDLARFLAIPEGYKIHGAKAEPEEEESEEEEAEETDDPLESGGADEFPELEETGGESEITETGTGELQEGESAAPDATKPRKTVKKKAKA